MKVPSSSLDMSSRHFFAVVVVDYDDVAYGLLVEVYFLSYGLFLIFPQWTYILASLFVIGGSVYFYFQTPSVKQSTYAPVILTASGMSIMYALSLTFATELIGEDTVSFKS